MLCVVLVIYSYLLCLFYHLDKISIAPLTMGVLTLFTPFFQFREIESIKFQSLSICTPQAN